MSKKIKEGSGKKSNAPRLNLKLINSKNQDYYSKTSEEQVIINYDESFDCKNSKDNNMINYNTNYCSTKNNPKVNFDVNSIDSKSKRKHSFQPNLKEDIDDPNYNTFSNYNFNSKLPLDPLISNMEYKEKIKISQYDGSVTKAKKFLINKYIAKKNKNFGHLKFQSTVEGPNTNFKTMINALPKINSTNLKSYFSKHLNYYSVFNNKIMSSFVTFENKKYLSTYKNLIEQLIIQNKKEFALLLLIYDEYDKFNLSDFLSMDNEPNNNFEVLKEYLNFICFENETFISSFLFLLNKINISYLEDKFLDNLINEFSISYYNENAEKYKSVDEIKQLCHITLQINKYLVTNKNQSTFLERQKLSENFNIEKSIVDLLFNYLENSPLNIQYDSHNSENISNKNMIIKSKASLNQINKLIESNIKETSISDKNQLTAENNNYSNNNKILPDLKESINNIKKKTHFWVKVLPNNEENSLANSYINHNTIELSNDYKDRQTWLDISEKFIYIKDSFSKCFCSKSAKMKISIEEIRNIIRGGNTLNIETNNLKTMFTLITNKYIIEFQNSNQYYIELFYLVLSNLVKENLSIISKTNKLIDKDKNELNKLNNNQTPQKETSHNLLIDIWSKVFINWDIYRSFLYKDKNFMIDHFSNRIDNSISIKDLNSLSRSIEDNKELIIDLWSLGLPQKVRKEMWLIFISNKNEICENLYYTLIQKENEFNGKFNKLSLNSECFNFNNNKSELCTVSLNDIEFNSIKKIERTINDKINQNIEKIIKDFSSQIENKLKFKTEIMKIIKSFCLFRIDVIYCKPISYISSIIYLNSYNSFDAFKLTTNFIINNYLFKLYTDEKNYIKQVVNLFINLFKKYLFTLYEHFEKIKYNFTAVFIKWIKNLFARTFPYEIVLKIWDNFLLRKNIFVFQFSIGIFYILHDYLVSVNDHHLINKVLLRFPVNEYNTDDLFSIIDRFDIKNYYNDEFKMYDIGMEKIELLKDL